MSEKTAVIIGAGPAGLTAAYKLLKETDVKPVILEESEYIGGISRTAVHNGNRLDLGGHRFFSKSDEVMNLWKEIMPVQSAPAKDDIILNTTDKEFAKEGPDPEKEDRVMLIRRRVSRIFFLRKFFDYPISVKAQTFINMGFCNTMKAGFGYLKSAMFKRKENSLEDFYINRFGKPLYQMFFEDYTEKLWGVHPSNIAPDWGSQRVKELSVFKVLMNAITKPFRKKDDKVATSLIEQFYYPKKGPGQLWETLASDIEKMGGKILFNHKVCGFNKENNRIDKVIAENNGEKVDFNCDYVISSMPVKDLVESIKDAPANVNEVASQLPYRDFITVGLLVNKLLIKNLTKLKTVSEIVPDCWIYIQERNVRLGRLQVFNNWSPYMVKDLENTVWIGLEYFCSEGDKMWEMSDEDFINFAIDELASIDIINKSDVLDSVRLKVKKAYPAYFGTYARFDEVKNYLNTIDNLYCVGRNGQHRYNNMDHSMLTSIRAVEAIRDGNNDRSEIWDVNTEEEYHETKSDDSEEK